MITVEQTDDGKWLAVCPHCRWKFAQPIHTKTRHDCRVTGERYIYVPTDWESRSREEKNPALSKRVSGHLVDDESAKNPTPPGLPRKVFNYTKATASHFAAGRPECTNEQVAERFAICQSNKCGFFIAKGDGLGQCAHQTCGCSLKRLTVSGENSKLRWADQECPAINPETAKPFWGKVNNDEMELRDNDGAREGGQPSPKNHSLARLFRFLRSLVVH